MLSAKEALLKIETVFSLSQGHLTDGGIELSELEFDYIKTMIHAGLGVIDEIQN